MATKNSKRLFWSIGIIVLTAGVLYVCYLVNMTINRVRAQTTEARMVGVYAVLVVAQPETVDSSKLRSLLRNNPVNNYGEDYASDGWGHPFKIEVLRDTKGLPGYRGLLGYRVIALGRSGRLTSCCSPSVGHNWDLNAVLDDSGWVQLWDF